MRRKYEVFKKFKEFKTLLENRFGKKIKVLRTNNRGELCGKEFNQFYRQHGISQENTTPYMP